MYGVKINSYWKVLLYSPVCLNCIQPLTLCQLISAYKYHVYLILIRAAVVELH